MKNHRTDKRPGSLNHSYRLVWSEDSQSFVPVAETKKTKGRMGGGLASLIAGLLLACSGAAWAVNSDTLPDGAIITHGDATFSRNGNQLTIQQGSQKLITQWDQFNIGQNASVHFQQPNSNSAALNRIQDQNPSQILGQLSSNGQVFLINPNGITFGHNAQVNVGGLIASTLELSDEDFLNGRLNFQNNGLSRGEIKNLGHIQANGGVVALIANRVSNQGTIEANKGNVALAAGNQVTLDFNGDGLMTVTVEQGVLDALAENGGLIQADGGFVIMTTQARNDIYRNLVNNDGIIQAQTLQADASGRIMLMGGMSQGQVVAGGKLDASAPTTGDGGFIETSAANVQIQPDLKVTTRAENGKTGEWLIDPTDIEIVAGVGGDFAGETSSSSSIGADTLVANLANSNITVQTPADGSEDGNITVSAEIVWNVNTRLTLDAHNNIYVNAKIENTNTTGGGVYFDAVNNHSAVQFDSNGKVVIHNAEQLQWMNTALAGNYELGSNIDLDGVTWTPVGDTSGFGRFTGQFDGMNYTISNLTAGTEDAQYVGLFGAASDATFRNVTLDGAQITGGAFLGALAGHVQGTSIAENITVTSDARASKITIAITPTTPIFQVSNVGGVVGQVIGGSTVNNIQSSANISGHIDGKVVFAVGGLFGSLSTSNDVTNLTNYGNVELVILTPHRLNQVGGLLGELYHNPSISVSNLTMNGDVTAVSRDMVLRTGGVIGSISGVGTLTLTNALMNGDVNTAIEIDGTEHRTNWGQSIGGLIGQVSSSSSTLNLNSSEMMGNVNVLTDGNKGEDEWGLTSIAGIIGDVARVTNLTDVHMRGDLTVEYGGNAAMDAFGHGGLMGVIWNPVTITDSTVTGSITGVNSVGGLAGEAWAGITISNSHFLGSSITATGSHVGGLLANVHDFYGPIGDAVTITASSAQGTISGQGYVGGLVGKLPTNAGWAAHQISNSHSTANVTGTYSVGGLIGYAANTQISDAYATGNVVATDSAGNGTGYSDAGGLVGSFSGTISASRANGSVTSSGRNTGGLVGYLMDAGVINTSYATGNVTIQNSTQGQAGGLVGSVQAGATGNITNAYATGNVSANNSTSTGVGGLIGLVRNSGSGLTVTNTYSTGLVTTTGTTDVGGLIGNANGATVNDSYWDTQTSGQATSSGGTGKTTAEMRDPDTYAGWNTTFWSFPRDGRGDAIEGYEYGMGGLPFLTEVTRVEDRNGAEVPVILFAGGWGDAAGSGVYTITTAQQLQNINLVANLGYDFRLSNSIDLQSISWSPIGNSDAQFTGNFDGQNHTISGLLIDSNDPFVGFFGFVHKGWGEENVVTIQNLVLANVDISGSFDVGGLVGRGTNIHIENVSVSGTVSGTDNVGGLIGFMVDADNTVLNSHSSANVSGTNRVGGLIGLLMDSAITGSSATGNVAGDDSVGGLVGRSVAYDDKSTITDSFATGAVNGTEAVGGLVGYAEFTSIVQSYAEGDVTVGVSSSNVGGLVGLLKESMLKETYATGDITAGNGAENIGGLVGRAFLSEITQSYSSASVTAGNDAKNIGGLIGMLEGRRDGYDGESLLEETYATGNVTAGNNARNIGGLVGQFESPYQDYIRYAFAVGEVTVGTDSENIAGLVGWLNGGVLNRTYAAGEVSVGEASTGVGGLVGALENSRNAGVFSSFWDTTTSGLSTSAGGIGKTTVEMNDFRTFTDASPSWSVLIDEDRTADYPMLRMSGGGGWLIKPAPAQPPAPVIPPPAPPVVVEPPPAPPVVVEPPPAPPVVVEPPPAPPVVVEPTPVPTPVQPPATGIGSGDTGQVSNQVGNQSRQDTQQTNVTTGQAATPRLQITATTGSVALQAPAVPLVRDTRPEPVVMPGVAVTWIAGQEVVTNFARTAAGSSMELPTPALEQEVQVPGLAIFRSRGEQPASLESVVEVRDSGNRISSSPSTTNAVRDTADVAQAVVTAETQVEINQENGSSESMNVSVTEDGLLIIEASETLLDNSADQVTLLGVAAARNLGISVNQLSGVVLKGR